MECSNRNINIDENRCIPSQHPSFRWVRRKRRAIKSGGGSLLRNKGGGGGGAPGTRRQKKKNPNKDDDDYDMAPPFCDPLENEYIQKEVITPGDDENATEFSSGALLKVSCIHGFGVNLPNETVRCVQGKWKPKVPQCNALPCKIPYIIHGTLFDGNGTKALFFMESAKHMKNVYVKCSRGYVLRGSKRMVCWYGEWDVDDIPECVP
ncbi:unnamed protein product, partial [Allacma fusca]